MNSVQNESPCNKLTDIREILWEYIPKSPPNVFIGDPVRVPFGFPIEAFGNDGLLEVREQLLPSSV